MPNGYPAAILIVESCARSDTVRAYGVAMPLGQLAVEPTVANGRRWPSGPIRRSSVEGQQSAANHQ